MVGVVFQSPCLLCDRATPDLLCQACVRQLRQCQLAADDSIQNHGISLFVWGDYSGILKRSIATLKYNQQPQLAQPLGQWLAQAWLAAIPHPPPLVVVPIPMHPDKQKQRGFNQAELLADSFCRYTRLPLQCHGLCRIRATQAQFSLSLTARATNLTEAFALGLPFQRRPPTQAVLLLDDIYTTGTTARSAAQTLIKAGIDVHGIVAIAKPTWHDQAHNTGH